MPYEVVNAQTVITFKNWLDEHWTNQHPFTSSNGLKFHIILRLKFTQKNNILKSPEPWRVTRELTEWCSLSTLSSAVASGQKRSPVFALNSFRSADAPAHSAQGISLSVCASPINYNSAGHITKISSTTNIEEKYRGTRYYRDTYHLVKCLISRPTRNALDCDQSK